jgi:hypothetical protein
MQLGGWQRIGIILSIVWALGAAIYQRNADIEHAQDFMSLAYKACTESKLLNNDSDWSSCDQESAKHWEIWLEGSWRNVALKSFVPIPFGWGVAYLLLAIGRWVRTGFKKG